MNNLLIIEYNYIVQKTDAQEFSIADEVEVFEVRIQDFRGLQYILTEEAFAAIKEKLENMVKELHIIKP